MAAPTWVGTGAASSGTVAVSPAKPVEPLQANDIEIGVAESAGNESYLPPAGWAHVPGSPVNVTTLTRLTVLWHRRGDGSAPGDAVASWGDPGNHAIGRIGVIRGCPTTGNPWDATPQTSQETTADTSAAWPAVTTTVVDCLMLFLTATGRDVASTANLGALTGGTGLTLITERMDNWTSSGTGGGFGLVTAVKAAIGSTGSPVATMGSTDAKAFMTLALAPIQTGTNYTANPADAAGGADSARLDRGESATDTAGASDAVTLIRFYVAASADAAGATDAVGISLSTTAAVNSTDGAGGTDTAVAVQGLARAAADAAAAPDSAPVVLGYAVTIADLADAFDIQAPQRVKITELPASSAAATDTATPDLVTGQPSLTPADAAGISDVAALEVGRAAADIAAGSDAARLDRLTAAGDTAAATDAVAQAVGAVYGLADAAGATDQAQAELSGASAQTPADAAAAADAVAVVQANARTIGDPAGAADATALGVERSAGDLANATDSTIAAQGPARSAADSLGVTDAAAAALDASRAPADTAAASDSAVSVADRGVADTAGLSDSALAVQGNVRGPADLAGATDQAQAELSGSSVQSLGDTASAADAAAAVMARVVTVGDLLGLIDSPSRVVGLGQTLADVASGTDALAAQSARVCIIADVAGATDLALVPTGTAGRFTYHLDIGVTLRPTTGTTPRVLAGVTYRP